jgi:S-adenosylmethionine:tRNA ribosyltransferase-isomerase
MPSIQLETPLRTSDFDYDLPPEYIAQTPIEPRDQARMMVLEREHQSIAHRHIYDLPQFLHEGDLLVLNDTRVIPARLYGRKETGGRVEIFLIKPLNQESWEVMVRGKNLGPGKRIHLGAVGSQEIWATITEDRGGPLRTVTFSAPLETWLQELGQIPLPPYIHEALADPPAPQEGARQDLEIETSVKFPGKDQITTAMVSSLG